MLLFLYLIASMELQKLRQKIANVAMLLFFLGQALEREQRRTSAGERKQGTSGCQRQGMSRISEDKGRILEDVNKPQICYRTNK